MNYYEELLKGSVVSIGERFPKDSSLLIVACAEVEKLRAQRTEIMEALENCLPYLPVCTGVLRDAMKALNPPRS